MYRLSSLFILLFASVWFTSCHKEKNTTTHFAPTGDYLIVGATGGFIAPTSPSPYSLIADSSLREDTLLNSTNIPTAYSGFNFDYVLPQARYDTVAAGILSAIPSELLAENGASIGAYVPDVGYTDVRARIASVDYTWKFEGNQSGSSAGIQLFLQKLGKIMY